MSRLEFEKVVDQLVQKNPREPDKEKRFDEWQIYLKQYLSVLFLFRLVATQNKDVL